MKPKAGDIVELIDTGQMYLQYELAAEKMKMGKWKCGNSSRIGDKAKVIGSIPHPGQKICGNLNATILLGLEFDNGEQVVIGEKGVKVIRHDILPDDLFVI